MRIVDQSGCVLLRRMMHQPTSIGVRNTPRTDDVVQQALNGLAGLHPVLDPTQRVERGDNLDRWYNLRLPFNSMWVEGIAPGMRTGSYVSRIGDVTPTSPPGTKHVLGFVSFCQHHDQPQPMAAGILLIHTDDNGDALETRSNMFFDNGIDEPGSPRSMNFQTMVAYPAALTIGLMNDPKITTVELNHDRAIKKYLQRQDIPDAKTTYRVMVLRDDLVKAGGKVDPANPGKLPLHIVRGHWSEYGINGKKRLFGKLTGRFFFTESERGDIRNGRVISSHKMGPDYVKGRKPRSMAEVQAVDDAEFAAATSPLNQDQPARQEARQ